MTSCTFAIIIIIMLIIIIIMMFASSDLLVCLLCLRILDFLCGLFAPFFRNRARAPYAVHMPYLGYMNKIALYIYTLFWKRRLRFKKGIHG